MMYMLFLAFLSAQLMQALGGDARAQRRPRQGCQVRFAAQGRGYGNLLKTSGNFVVDQSMNRELLTFRFLYRVNPSLFLVAENGAPNAFATSDVLERGYNDGTVVFGTRLLQAEIAQTGPLTNFTIPAVLAHEFAHILQFQKRQDLPVKLFELQADWLGGWAMANREQRGSPWTNESFRQTVMTLFQKGDYAYNSPDHHGTPRERMDAAAAGFRNSQLSLAEAYRASDEYVRGDSERIPDSEGATRLTVGDRTRASTTEAQRMDLEWLFREDDMYSWEGEIRSTDSVRMGRVICNAEISGLASLITLHQQFQKDLKEAQKGGQQLPDESDYQPRVILFLSRSLDDMSDACLEFDLDDSRVAIELSSTCKIRLEPREDGSLSLQSTGDCDVSDERGGDARNIKGTLRRLSDDRMRLSLTTPFKLSFDVIRKPN